MELNQWCGPHAFSASGNTCPIHMAETSPLIKTLTRLTHVQMHTMDRRTTSKFKKNAKIE